MTTTTDYRTTVRVNASADAVFDAVTTRRGARRVVEPGDRLRPGRW